MVKRLTSGEDDLTEDGWFIISRQQPVYRVLEENGMLATRPALIKNDFRAAAERSPLDAKLTQLGLDYLIDKGFKIPENTPVFPTPPDIEEQK